MATIDHTTDSRNAAVALEDQTAGVEGQARRGFFTRLAIWVLRPFPGLFEFVQLVHEDWGNHGRDWTLPGFRAVAVYRFGVWQDRMRPKLLRLPFRILYMWLYRFVRNHYGIELYYTVKVGRRFRISHQSGIVIHPRAEFGDDCLIRQNVTVGAINRSRIAGAPKLGSRVALGCGAAILGPVTIGDDTRIGANVVVMTDIPAGCSVVTAPPRIIQMPNSQPCESNGKSRR